MNIKFEKWHGCRNDFIIIHSTYNENKFLQSALCEQSEKICSRKGDGVGADGIVLILKENKSDHLAEKIVIINQDGSLAKNCGNALRCVASSIYNSLDNSQRKIDIPDYLELKIFSNSYLCQKNPRGDITVNMGSPVINQQNSWHSSYTSKLQALLSKVQYEEISSCSLGNDHIVVFCENSPKELFKQIYSLWSSSDLSSKVNLHVSCRQLPDKSDQKISQKIVGTKVSEIYQTFSWERGCGPTQACGSGACAIAALSLATGFISRSEWIAVKMPGGTLYAQQVDKGKEIKLSGPANLSFTGTLIF
jgi:diaminopimelate epimerase